MCVVFYTVGLLSKARLVTLEALLRQEPSLRSIFITRAFLGGMSGLFSRLILSQKSAFTGRQCDLATLAGHSKFLVNYFDRIVRFVDGDDTVELEDINDISAIISLTVSFWSLQATRMHLYALMALTVRHGITLAKRFRRKSHATSARAHIHTLVRAFMQMHFAHCI